MTSLAFGREQPAFTWTEAGENYERLLGAARAAALRIVDTPAEGLGGAPAYIHRASRELIDAVPASEDLAPSSGAVFECLNRVVEAWPDLAAGGIQGEQVFSGNPGLWKRAMTEWPMGDFAQAAARFMIERNLLGGKVVELGAGVGSCSALVADHVTSSFIRTDIQPFLLKRQKIAGSVEQYDFNEPGPWKDLDTIFAVNALHCARDKGRTLSYLFAMLREGGVLVLAEGMPFTDERGTPWALNLFFGLFKGWWDVGGFLKRDEWFAALEGAGANDIGFADRKAGRHDLGGLIWAAKP